MKKKRGTHGWLKARLELAKKALLWDKKQWLSLTFDLLFYITFGLALLSLVGIFYNNALSINTIDWSSIMDMQKGQMEQAVRTMASFLLTLFWSVLLGFSAFILSYSFFKGKAFSYLTGKKMTIDGFLRLFFFIFFLCLIFGSIFAFSIRDAPDWMLLAMFLLFLHIGTVFSVSLAGNHELFSGLKKGFALEEKIHEFIIPYALVFLCLIIGNWLVIGAGKAGELIALLLLFWGITTSRSYITSITLLTHEEMHE